MKVTVLYVGSSLLAPLRNAEREINIRYDLSLSIAAYNFGAVFADNQWRAIENDLCESDVVFIIHVMDGENVARLIPILDSPWDKSVPVIVINCMPELMKRTRLGRLDFARLTEALRRVGSAQSEVNPTSLLSSIGSWIGRQARGGAKTGSNGQSRAQYLKYVDRLPSLLRYVPNAGALRDVKNYLMLVAYFLQPTPANIRSMILFSLKQYSNDERLKRIEVPAPETMPSVAIYHPDASSLFENFADYSDWYVPRRQNESKVLDPSSTVGLLLMRPQIVSHARKHYDALIRAIEAEGLSVIPALSTLMDNREACEKFFVEEVRGQRSEVRTADTNQNAQLANNTRRGRVSQIVSLTGFSFVGGPAMNDSEAASEFLRESNIPYRSLISLDTQTIESWRESLTGLNPLQTGMQVAIPEIDGATEPFVFGGIPARSVEPAPLADRCARIARRLKRWNRLQTARREDLRVALVLYCFPPNKGNIGTAADLDVLVSLFDILTRLKQEGYDVTVPASADALREMLLGGNSKGFDATANITYRMTVDEYREQCTFVDEIEAEWGAAPGAINAKNGELLIQGVNLGNAFIGVQPTFGYEDDPMRLLMSKGGAPHHGFAAFYAYVDKIFKADAVIHVGTHGALEFMPGKQVGLSSECWPDRLIGELPNIYIYSVNNPSEGTIAKRRSYAELISYLTPPIENAGLYKGLASLKELITAYRQSSDPTERSRLFQSIEEASKEVNLSVDSQVSP